MNENQTVILGKVQMTPRGEYSSETAYAFLDIVSYGGGSYLAKKQSTNVPVTNTTYWLCIAEKGNVGEAAGFGTPTIEVTELDPDSEPTAEVTSDGEDTAKVFHFSFGIPQGKQGDTGNGIESIEKTGTEGNVDTYTITYTDETTTTFEVTNGTDGAAAGFGTPTVTIDDQVGTPYIEISATGSDTAKVFNFAFHNMKGIPGVSPAVTVTEIEGGHEVTITDADHPDGQSFNVMDGEDGASDAGDVTYDPTESYAAGSVGAAVKEQSQQIANLDTRVSLLEDWHKDDLTYEQIAQIVRSGQAKKYFKVGDQIAVKYTATNGTEYDMPFDVVDFKDVTLENGNVVPGMIIQSHYATLEAVQFDAAEVDRPEEEDYLGQIKQYGYNRWSQSGYRQWLNSANEKGDWWTAQNDYDVAPSQHSSVNGFMHGLPADFVAMLKPVKVETCLNYRYPSGSSGTYVYDTTYDTFFPASREEEYIVANEPNHREGTAWQYWKDRLAEEAEEKGESLPQATYASADVTHALTSHIRYALENHSSAQVCRLRSANRANANTVWYVYSTGYVYYYAANYSVRCAPACVIC